MIFKQPPVELQLWESVGGTPGYGPKSKLIGTGFFEGFSNTTPISVSSGGGGGGLFLSPSSPTISFTLTGRAPPAAALPTLLLLLKTLLLAVILDGLVIASEVR